MKLTTPSNAKIAEAELESLDMSAMIKVVQSSLWFAKKSATFEGNKAVVMQTLGSAISYQDLYLNHSDHSCETA